MFKNRKDIVNSISISVIILIGIFLRIRQFIYNRPLWLDELMLALNIRNRSYTELLLPLDNNQGAPVLFLWIEKCFNLLSGNEDLLLRIFPLLAGVLSIFLVLLVSRSFQSSAGTLLSVGLFVILPNLVYFSSEAKQYSSDVFISLLLIWLAIRSLKPSASKTTILLFGFCGFIGMWLSHPAVFILAGSGITLGIECIRSKNYQKLSWLGICILLWLASFALEFSITLNSIRNNSNLNNYWDFGFMPFPPWKNLSWFGTTLTDYVSFMGYRDSIILFIPLSLLMVGSTAMLIRKWQAGFVLLSPIILMLIGSSFEMYPVANRLLLFTFPIAILLIVEGIETIRVEFSKERIRLGWAICIVLSLLVLAQPLRTSFTYLREPYIKEDMKSVLSDLRENYKDGDIIYLYYRAKFSFWYYADQYGFDDSDYIIGIKSTEKPEKYIEELDRLTGKKRVWIVLTHNCSTCSVNEFDYILGHLNQIGTLRKKYIEKGAYLYLYNLKQPLQ